jgi:hypothetical protein
MYFVLTEHYFQNYFLVYCSNKLFAKKITIQIIPTNFGTYPIIRCYELDKCQNYNYYYYNYFDIS